MTIRRMGISSLMGYKEGGGVDPLDFLKKIAEKDYDESFDKYQQRLSSIQSPSQPVTIFDAASKLGAGLLAQQAEKFPSIGRGLGMGFQSLSEEISKRRADKKKEEQAVAMKAMELSLQDEKQGEKFLNDYALKMIDMQNKDIKTVDFDTSMLVDATDAEGNLLINPQTGVGFKEKTTLTANDPQINDLLTLGATAIDRASTNINLQGGGSELDKRRAAKIADAEAKWQEEADAASALRDQISIARSLANELGEDGFGAAENLTLGMRNIMAGLGMDSLVDVDKVADQQALTQTSIGFVMALVGKTKGAISNREMDIFFAASPTLGSTYKGYMKMLGYMDRIAELSEKYNAEWQKESLRLSNENASLGEINAAFANFKTEFRSKPENRLIQTAEEKRELEAKADQKTYNTVNSNYLRVQKNAQQDEEKDTILELKQDVVKTLSDPNASEEEKEDARLTLELINQMGK